MAAIIRGNGKFGEYFSRFTITDTPKCVCNKNSQSADHILWECELLNFEKNEFRRSALNS